MTLSEERKKQLIECHDCNINEFSLKGKEFYSKIVNVYDADTCRAVFYLNDELVKYTIRLKGIDSPEIRPPSKDKYRKYQIEEAKKSRNRLIQLCTDCDIEVINKLSKKKLQEKIDKNNKIIRIKCEEFDKYGRLLAHLYADYYEGQEKETAKETEKDPAQETTKLSLNEQLIKEGYAYPYEGGTKRKFDYSKYVTGEEKEKEKETEKETS